MILNVANYSYFLEIQNDKGETRYLLRHAPVVRFQLNAELIFDPRVKAGLQKLDEQAIYCWKSLPVKLKRACTMLPEDRAQFPENAVFRY